MQATTSAIAAAYRRVDERLRAGGHDSIDRNDQVDAHNAGTSPEGADAEWRRATFTSPETHHP